MAVKSGVHEIAGRTLKYQQGQLDGLCGIYSVVNALNYLLENNDTPQIAEDLFEVVLRAIPRKMYPDVLFSGTTLADLRLVGKAAVRYLDSRWNLQIKVEQPFIRRRFVDQAQFLEELEQYMAERAAVAILGIDWSALAGHWTVLQSIRSDELKLIDSSGLKSLKRRGTSVRASSKPRLCPDQTTVFNLVAVEGVAIRDLP